MSSFHTIGIFLSLLLCLHESHALVNMTVYNNCSKTIWPARYDYRRDTGPFVATEYPTGWELPSAASTTINFTTGWSGYLWARQECDQDTWRCLTGNCGGNGDAECYKLPNEPVTEIGWGVQNDSVSYSVTFNQGFNLGVQIQPSSSTCESRACGYDFNKICSASNQAVKSSTNQTLACFASNDEIHTTYKEQCPQIESLADDSDTEANAAAADGTCTDMSSQYTVTFCPNGDSMSDAVESSTPNSPSSSSSLSTGAIAGIAVGGVAVLALIAVLVFMFMRKRKREATRGEIDPYTSADPFVANSPFVTEAIPLAWKVTPFTAGTGDRKSGDGFSSPELGGSFKQRDSLIPSSTRTTSFPDASTGDSSFHQRNASSSSGPPPPDGARVSGTDSSRAVDIRRLFEDREFEGELLNFLADRMDPPPSHGEPSSSGSRGGGSRGGETEGANADAETDEFGFGTAVVPPPPMYSEDSLKRASTSR